MTKGTLIKNVESGATEEHLREKGLEIANIVGSLEINEEIRLGTIANEIPNTEYNPDVYQNLVYDSPESKTGKFWFFPVDIYLSLARNRLMR